MDFATIAAAWATVAMFAACGAPDASRDAPAAATAKPAAPRVAPEPAVAHGSDAQGGTGEDDTASEEAPPTPAPVEIAPIGVAECDAYIEGFLACVEAHAPAAERDGQLARLREQVGAWKQTHAGNREVADQALALGCKAALEAAKVESKGWGCSL